MGGEFTNPPKWDQPQRVLTTPNGPGVSFFSSSLTPGALLHGDLCHGHQHAGEDGGLHQHPEVGRLGVPDFARRGVHPDERARGPAWQGQG